MGLHEYDGALGENGPSTHLAYERLATRIAQGVEELADSAFTGDDWLDRRGFLALLRTHLFFSRRKNWRTDPQIHCGSGGKLDLPSASPGTWRIESPGSCPRSRAGWSRSSSLPGAGCRLHSAAGTALDEAGRAELPGNGDVSDRGRSRTRRCLS